MSMDKLEIEITDEKVKTIVKKLMDLFKERNIEIKKVDIKGLDRFYKCNTILNFEIKNNDNIKLQFEYVTSNIDLFDYLLIFSISENDKIAMEIKEHLKNIIKEEEYAYTFVVL